jgi:hypothetical protein
MTVEEDRPVEPTEPSDHGPFSPLLLRQAIADEDAFWAALETREQELRDALDDAPTPREQHAVRADLASITWFASVWHAVQHNARCLKNFDDWLETPPSRKKLFAQFCRHAVPAEWDRSLAEKSPPFIFATGEAFHAHLGHCQLCDAQRQLAEGRRLRAEPDRPTWGDQLVREFLTTFCGEALAAVCQPSTQRRSDSRTPHIWSETPPLRLALAASARPKVRREFEIEIPLRLVGPSQPGHFKLTITAQHIDAATRQAESPLEVWPGRGGESVFEWRPAAQGWREFPLVVPAPAEPGRMILRYAVRKMPPSPSRRSYSPPAPTAVSAVVIDFLSRPRE